MRAPVTKSSKPRNQCGGLLIMLVALAASGGPPTALGAEQAPVAKRLVAQPWAIPETAADIARREIGGRVLSVTPLEGGQRGYRVRLLLDGGRVTTILVDPKGRVRTTR